MCTVLSWRGATAHADPSVQLDLAVDGTTCSIRWTLDSAEYSGQLGRGGGLTGAGVALYGADGLRYDGQFERGLRQGRGLLRRTGGGEALFEGEWLAGTATGQGTMLWLAATSVSQVRYDGEWSSGRRSGRGEMRYPSGDVYVGEWYNGRRHGQGTMKWASTGERYSGQWKAGLMHGRGEYHWPLREPVSPHRSAFCHTYSGDWVDGRRHGQGTFRYSTGAVYTGGWMDNLKHGYGMFVLAGGRVVEGEWRLDVLLGSDSQLALDHVANTYYGACGHVDGCRDIDAVAVQHRNLLASLYDMNANCAHIDDATEFCGVRLGDLLKVIDSCGVKLSGKIDYAAIGRDFVRENRHHPTLHKFYERPHDVAMPLSFPDFVMYLATIAFELYGVGANTSVESYDGPAAALCLFLRDHTMRFMSKSSLPVMSP